MIQSRMNKMKNKIKSNKFSNLPQSVTKLKMKKNKLISKKKLQRLFEQSIFYKKTLHITINRFKNDPIFNNNRKLILYFFKEINKYILHKIFQAIN